MKRAGVLALSVCCLAAAAMLVHALGGRPEQREAAPLGAAGEVDGHLESAIQGEVRDVPDLTPGRGQLPAGTGDGSPTSFERLELVPGPNHRASTRGQAETGGRVPVRFIAQNGAPPGPDERVDYVAFTGDPEQIVRASLEWSRGPGGELWLPRSELEALLAEVRGNRPLYLAGVGRRQRRPRIGFVCGPLDAEMPELVLTEVPSAHAEICVLQAGTSPFVLSIEARLLAATSEDSRLLHVAARGGLGFEWCTLHFAPGQRSVPMPNALLPGRWRFSFGVASAPMMKLSLVEVELAAGRHELALELPDLYEVTVHAPSLGSGVRIRLRPERTPTGAAPGRLAQEYAQLDTNQRTVFSGLPAGHYVLTHGASYAPQNIVVPCGEVLYEPRHSDAFEVRLAPLDSGGRGALAHAGFQTGDVLLDFNGRGLRDHDDLEALVEVIAENAASVRVRRGAHTLELRLGPMPDPGDPWATFDAEFVPAWR